MVGVTKVQFFGKTFNTSNSPHSGLIAVGVLVGFGLLIGLVFYIQARQRKAMANFSTKQGWQPLPTDDAALISYVPTYLRTNSQSIGHKYTMAYKTQVNGQDIVFFQYIDDVHVITGSTRFSQIGDSSRTENQQIKYAIAAFNVPQTFGTLFIFHHSRLGNMGLHQGLQKFNLEGDFSSHFDVYAPQGSAVETLSVLTPDIMAFLIDFGQHWHCNVQISGNLIIIEADAQLISPSKIPDLLNYAATLGQKLATKPIVNNTVQPSAGYSEPSQQPPAPFVG